MTQYLVYTMRVPVEIRADGSHYIYNEYADYSFEMVSEMEMKSGKESKEENKDIVIKSELLLMDENDENKEEEQQTKIMFVKRQPPPIQLSFRELEKRVKRLAKTKSQTLRQGSNKMVYSNRSLRNDLTESI